MLKKIFLSLFLTAQLPLFGQVFKGDWYGNLDAGYKIPLILHIQEIKKNKYSAALDSPSQKRSGLSASEVKAKKDSIFIYFKDIGIEYRAKAVSDGLDGTFKQMGMNFPLKLVADKSVINTEPPKRPQHPKPPFSYKTEEVTFENTQDQVMLSGTLTYPAEGNNFKAVVLVTGSGPQNRDEELFDHKPFLVIADYLTKNGIAVLRYDDRGVGKSKGNFSEATVYNFKNDAEAAVNYLKTLSFIDKNQVGVIGHSEGGMVAEILAAQDPQVINFAVLLAGPAIPISELMIQQNKDILTLSKAPQQEIDIYLNNMKLLYAKLKAEENCDSKCLLEFMKGNFPDFNEKMMQYSMLVKQTEGKWFKEFIKFDPQVYLEKITIPVLALNGDKDIQVEGKSNLAAVDAGLEKAGNQYYRTFLYPKLNHLFQPCETGAIGEYQQIEITFSEKVLEDIVKWINTLR